MGRGIELTKKRYFFFEIWTNGSLTPKEALHEASRKLIDLFSLFLNTEEENLHLDDNQRKIHLPLFTFHDKLAKQSKKEKKLSFDFD
jgi:DNA-directed RNA polymerase subunit alpha